MQRNVTERTEWRAVYNSPFYRGTYVGPVGNSKKDAIYLLNPLSGDKVVGYQKRTVYETPWEDAE